MARSASLTAMATTISRATAPAWILLMEDTPPTVAMVWGLTVAAAFHVPGFLSDMFETPGSWRCWLHCTPMFMMLGLLAAVAATSFAYGVAEASAAATLVWMAAVPAMLLVTVWGKQLTAAKGLKHPNHPSHKSPTPPAAVQLGLAVVAACLPAIALGDDSSAGSVAAIVAAVCTALVLELFRSIVTASGLTPFSVGFPVFLWAAVFTTIGAAAGAPGADGFKFSGTDAASLFGWVGASDRLAYTAALAVAAGIVGYTVFTSTCLSAAAPTSTVALRVALVLEPVVGVGLAAAVGKQDMPDALTWVAAGVTIAAVQALLTVAFANASRLLGTGLWLPAVAMGRVHADLPAPLLSEIIARGLGVRNVAGKGLASLKNLTAMMQVNVTTGGSGQPAGAHVVSNAPHMLSRSHSGVLSLRDLNADLASTGDSHKFKAASGKLPDVKPEQLSASKCATIVRVLSKYGVTSVADLANVELPPQLQDIAKHVLIATGVERAASRASHASTAAGSHSRSVTPATASGDRVSSTPMGPVPMLPRPAAAFVTGEMGTPIPTEVAVNNVPVARPRGKKAKGKKAAPDDVISQSVAKMNKKELKKVMELLEFYNIRSPADMESADMPADVRAFLTRLMPDNALPSTTKPARPSANRARRMSGQGTPLTAERRASDTSTTVTTTIDLQQVYESPAPPRKKQLAPLAGASQYLPGAIMTPTPKTGIPGVPVFAFSETGGKKKRSPYDAGVQIRPIPATSEDDSGDDGWDDVPTEPPAANKSTAASGGRKRTVRKKKAAGASGLKPRVIAAGPPPSTTDAAAGAGAGAGSGKRRIRRIRKQASGVPSPRTATK